MLRNFRSVFKGNQTPMTVVMAIVGVGLLAYLAPSNWNAESQDSAMARVYGREILRRDVGKAMGDLMRRMGKQANMEGMQSQLQAWATESLVGQKLREELAERHGIVVTDVEVRLALEAQLKQVPVFQGPEGKLKPIGEINDILRENGTTLTLWEQDVRQSLLGQKLLSRMATLVPVNEAWVELEHRLRNEKLAFEYVSLPADASAVADPGDAPLQAFLLASGTRFLQGPRRVIQYVALDQAALGKAVEVNEAALKTAYESKKAQYTELKARHILIKAQGDAQVQDAEKKILSLRAQLLAKPGDFAKVAEAQSDDPGSRTQGGDLGWFKSGMMMKSFEDAAMALKEGELSHPVKTPYGVHLIRLEGRRSKTFEEAREELASQLKQERFNSVAKERLEQLRKRAGERGDLAGAAKAVAKPGETLKVAHSEPFLDEPSASIKDLPGAALLLSEAFRLKIGQVSKVQRAADRYVVYRVTEEKPASVPPFAEVRAKVLETWKLEEARKALLAKVQGALASGNLKAAGEVKSQAETALSALGELGQHPAIRKALLETPEGKLTPALWNPEGQLWAARILTRKAAEPLNFEKRQSLVKEIQSSASQKLLQAELMDLDTKGRLKPGFSSLWGRLGGIWIDQETGRKADVQVEAEE